MKRLVLISSIIGTLALSCRATNLTTNDIQGSYLLNLCELMPELNYMQSTSEQVNQIDPRQYCDMLNITMHINNGNFYITYNSDVKDVLIESGIMESEFANMSGQLQIDAGSILYIVRDGKRDELGIITRNPSTGDLRIINSGELSHDINPIINLHKL